MLIKAAEVSNIQRLRVPRDVANVARRLQSLQPGDYAIIVKINHDNSMTWQVAPLGNVENAKR